MTRSLLVAMFLCVVPCLSGLFADEVAKRENARITRFESTWESKITDDTFAWLSELPNLEYVNVSKSFDWKVSDAAIGKLGTLKKLRVLIGVRITRESVAQIATILTLEELQCSLKEGDVETASLLATIPRLEKLSIGFAEVGGDSQVAAFSKATRLRELILGGARLGATGLRALSCLRNLQSLELCGCEADAGAFSALSCWPALERVSISGWEPTIPQEALRRLASIRTLRSLTIHQGRSDGSFLLAFNSRSCLEELDLIGNFTETEIAQIARLERLRSIRLEVWNALDRGCVDCLADHTGLVEFDVPWHVTDETLSRLVASSPEIESLSVEESPVTSKGVALLSGMRRLTKLNLCWCKQVGDRGLESLSRCDALEELNIGCTGITDAGIANLARLPRLRILDLSGTAVTDAGISRLATMTALEALSIDVCVNITDAAQTSLLKLKSLKHIRAKECTGIKDADKFQRPFEKRGCDVWGDDDHYNNEPIRKPKREPYVPPPPADKPDID